MVRNMFLNSRNLMLKEALVISGVWITEMRTCCKLREHATKAVLSADGTPFPYQVQERLSSVQTGYLSLEYRVINFIWIFPFWTWMFYASLMQGDFFFLCIFLKKTKSWGRKWNGIIFFASLFTIYITCACNQVCKQVDLWLSCIFFFFMRNPNR